MSSGTFLRSRQTCAARFTFNIRENLLNDELKISFYIFSAVDNTHMSRKKEFDVSPGKVPDALFSVEPPSLREIRPSTCLIEDDITVEERFPFRPVQTDGAGE